MTMATQAEQIEGAARGAGLRAVVAEAGTDFAGRPTARYELGLDGGAAGAGSKALELEVSTAFDPEGERALAEGLRGYLGEVQRRLRGARPECVVTLSGLPLSLGRFQWPPHGSTSGADTFVVHGEARLETGEPSVLHAKVSAAMTQTFVEVIAAQEQPYAEGVIYNAVRKTMDQGQLELVKSGNRQPVPVTTRYYSAKQGRFVFNDTTESQRSEFLAAKVYWLSGVLGGGEAVWLLDPRDAQYLNATVAEMREAAEVLAGEGLIRLAADVEFGVPTDALLGHAEQYQAVLAESLRFLKPSFNESMRAGQTNM